jgi:phospholipase D1/2
MEARVNNNNNLRMRRALTRLVAVCLIAMLVLAFWRYSPLVAWADPDQLGSLFDRVSASPFAGPIVVAAFLLGSFVVFPATALIAATGVALGPWQGLIWASIGTLFSAIVNYLLAGLLPRRFVDRWFGPWSRKMRRRCERDGIVAIMIARNVPIAPFTLVNVVAAAAGVRFRDYVLGTILGMGPTIVALTILGDRLRGAWVAPTVQNVSLLVLAIALWFAVALGLQALSNRWISSRAV